MRKIVIIGPESTGKSTLSAGLAEFYHTKWCPEFAREYLLENGTDYAYEDLLDIAKGQLELEDKVCEAVKAEEKEIVFIDTDMYVMKVWCEFVFGKCHPWILQQIVERKYDGYLLCNTDLPWVKDELREYPDPATRKTLFSMYQDILVQQSVPWALVSGAAGERLPAAIKAVEGFMQH